MNHMTKYTSFSNTRFHSPHYNAGKAFEIDLLGKRIQKALLSQDKKAVSVWMVFSVSDVSGLV